MAPATVEGVHAAARGMRDCRGVSATRQHLARRPRLVGIILVAWEEDNTPNAKVVQAYNDSVTVLKEHISDRVRSLNTGPLTQTEINAVKADLTKAIEKRSNPRCTGTIHSAGILMTSSASHKRSNLSKRVNP